VVRCSLRLVEFFRKSSRYRQDRRLGGIRAGVWIWWPQWYLSLPSTESSSPTLSLTQLTVLSLPRKSCTRVDHVSPVAKLTVPRRTGHLAVQTSAHPASDYIIWGGGYITTRSLDRLHSFECLGDRWLKNSIGFGRKRSWPNRGTIPAFEGYHENFSQDSRGLGRDSNRASPEYESKNVPLRQPAQLSNYTNNALVLGIIWKYRFRSNTTFLVTQLKGNWMATCFGNFDSPSSDFSISGVERKVYRCPFLQTYDTYIERTVINMIHGQ
jgi:hypothetical protein